VRLAVALRVTSSKREIREEKVTELDAFNRETYKLILTLRQYRPRFISFRDIRGTLLLLMTILVWGQYQRVVLRPVISFFAATEHGLAGRQYNTIT
jgi:hypothetical protein